MTYLPQLEERRFGRSMIARTRRASERVMIRVHKTVLWIWCAGLMVLSTAVHAQQADFSGDWQTYWRTGSAVVSLKQDGTRVTGTYQPDDGSIAGTVEGRVLSGTWEQPGSSGRFVFALSEDGQVLTGRFGNGEYWNGFRDTGENGSGAWRLANGTPRETLRSILLAINSAVYSGDAGALRSVANLITYAGAPASAVQRAQRRTLMFNILDLSTLRIMDVPDPPGDGSGDTVSFDIGPAGTAEKITLEFISDAPGQWRLVLPTVDVLSAERDRLLEAVGHESMAELDLARSDSPRAILREFVQGTNSWNEGGRERALAVMDLSEIPDRLHDLEGPIYAEYLKRIIDRIAYVIWQEIPDNPDRSVPYIYFQHPVGNITIARVTEPAEDGMAPTERWKLTAETLAKAPSLLAAMQDLPVIGGLENQVPLSPYFRLRETVRTANPALVAPLGYLEIWQWLGLGATVIGAVLAAAIVSSIMRRLGQPETRAQGFVALALPTGILVAAVIVNWCVTRLGITQSGIPLIGALSGIFLVVGIAFLAYRLATLLGDWLYATARKTVSYVDEIASSLGTGLVKLLIVVGAIIAIADVVGLPYEGVITGLGVGGVALAFAARDTVSNMIGGGLLMADRPFQRGDLIELDGKLATVEEVGLRVTRLRGLDDTLLNVPNVQLSDRVITNWGKRRRRKLTMLVGATYDTSRDNLDAFVRGLRDLLLNQPKVDPNDVYVGLKGFGASSIDIELLYHLRVFDYTEQVEAQHRIVLEIIALAENLGVEFAFPTRTVHVAGSLPPALSANETTDQSAKSA